VTTLDASVAATRNAVSDALHDAPPGGLVLVACSGGADSMALACASAFVAPRAGLRAGLVTVDHGLQDGSVERAKRVAQWAASAGLVPAIEIVVDIFGSGNGPEAAAREARYGALIATAHEHDAFGILLGHTRDDQAETVLLALGRGSGPRGIAGMPVRRRSDGVELIRPFLEISRAQTQASCDAQGVEVWEDPHNQEPRFSRVRIRKAMTTLTDALGPGVVTNLARTASLIAADNEALDALATGARATVTGGDGTLDCAGLLTMAAALRTRILRSFALDLGASGGALSSAHIGALDALIVDWHGQGPVALPGGLKVVRRRGRLVQDH
jgi:tRNA(Ile)-lysidine synthase